MINETYMEAMMTLASDYDQMSQELFRLAHKLEDTPGYNPKNEMYSLVRTAEQATVGLRGLRHGRNGRKPENSMKPPGMRWASESVKTRTGSKSRSPLSSKAECTRQYALPHPAASCLPFEVPGRRPH